MAPTCANTGKLWRVNHRQPGFGVCSVSPPTTEHSPTRQAPPCAPVLRSFARGLGRRKTAPVQHASSTTALRSVCSITFRIPTILKRQPLRPNWTELNWRTAGSTPVSATKESTTYGLCAVTRCDAQRASGIPPQKTKPCCWQLARQDWPPFAHICSTGATTSPSGCTRRQAAAGDPYVASWPSVWRVGSTGSVAPEGMVGAHPHPFSHGLMDHLPEGGFRPAITPTGTARTTALSLTIRPAPLKYARCPALFAEPAHLRDTSASAESGSQLPSEHAAMTQNVRAATTPA